MKPFNLIDKVLFDGETALRSAKTRAILEQNLNIKVHAEPFYKRSYAERGVAEFKKKMKLKLELTGNI